MGQENMLFSEINTIIQEYVLTYGTDQAFMIGNYMVNILFHEIDTSFYKMGNKIVYNIIHKCLNCLDTLISVKPTIVIYDQHVVMSYSNYIHNFMRHTTRHKNTEYFVKAVTEYFDIISKSKRALIPYYNKAKYLLRFLITKKNGTAINTTGIVLFIAIMSTLAIK